MVREKQLLISTAFRFSGLTDCFVTLVFSCKILRNATTSSLVILDGKDG